MADLGELLASNRPLTWVFAGDSITQGVVHTHGSRSWTELVTEAIRWESGRVLDVCINTGIGGWTAPAVLRNFDHLIGRFTPDVVSVGLGMNDCCDGPAGRARFADTLGEIVHSSRQLGDEQRPVVVVLHTLNAIAEGAWNDPAEVAAYSEIVRDIAAQTGSVLVDHHRHWLDHFAGAQPWAWLDEPVHPNPAGHRAMAELTLRTLGLHA